MYPILLMIPYACDKNFDFHSDNDIKWFENNYMKMNSHKCHLFISGHKFEHLLAKMVMTKFGKQELLKF